MNYQPYTYLIKFKETGQLYYGVRWAKGCHPSEIWIKYFTNSEVVKELIKEYGKDSFEVLYTKNHATKESALKWEELYLVSVNGGHNDNYLNKSNGGKNFCVTEESILKNTGENHPKWGTHQTEAENKAQSDKLKLYYEHNASPSLGMRHTEEWKINHSNFISGENHPFFGKHLTEEHRKNIGLARIGKYCGENNPNFGKTGRLSPNAKRYIIIHPNGHEEFIIGIKEFCRDNNLNSSSMCRIANGIKSYYQHKGFKCRYATEEEILQWNY